MLVPIINADRGAGIAESLSTFFVIKGHKNNNIKHGRDTIKASEL